jgi:hypothetical protein
VSHALFAPSELAAARLSDKSNVELVRDVSGGNDRFSIVSERLAFGNVAFASIVQSNLAQSEDDALKALLGDSQGLCEITLLKRNPRDFSNFASRAGNRSSRTRLATFLRAGKRVINLAACLDRLAVSKLQAFFLVGLIQNFVGLAVLFRKKQVNRFPSCRATSYSIWV